MAKAKILRIYLDTGSLEHARQGGFGFVNRVRAAMEGCGYRVELCQNSDAERLKSVGRRGYALFEMTDPFHPRALTFRRAYYYPFWRIEATAKRWEFEVAETPFDAGIIDPELAGNWADKWRRYLFKGAAKHPERRGFVYVPLQGRLLDHRSFQTMSPLAMVAMVLDRERDRDILIGLHPGEDYSDAEQHAIEQIRLDNPRVTLRTGGMIEALQGCDYVVSQNSSAALSGFFFHKPAILFGQIDFHHIALNVAELGVDRAFEAVETHAPPYDQFLKWFILDMSIKADEADAEDRILDTLRRRGWAL